MCRLLIDLVLGTTSEDIDVQFRDPQDIFPAAAASFPRPKVYSVRAVVKLTGVQFRSKTTWPSRLLRVRRDHLPKSSPIVLQKE
jgi:hypothetical protein